MQDINGYERFIGLLPGCYSMGVSHPETFVAGANLVLNSAEAPLTALTVYGHSTQDGTPSPENPVPIVSAGDEGEIGVEVLGGNLADISQIVNLGGSSYVQISDTGFSFTYSEQEVNTRLNRIPCKLKKGKQYICTAERSSNYITIYLQEIEQYLKFGRAFTPNEDVNYIGVYVDFDRPYDTYTVEHFMVNVGDTALPWEPCKLPQTLTVSTPGGLPGIPVTSGGNYTDESGQQWVCDEVDFERGVYVQRVGKINVTLVDSYHSNEEFGAIANPSNLLNTGLRVPILSNYFHYDKIIKVDGIGFGYLNTIRLYYTLGSVEAFNEWLSQNDVVVYYPFATPIETPLPAEEIAAYKALHTYSPATTVSNDADAWMKVGYYGLTTIQKLEKEAIVINGGKS